MEEEGMSEFDGDLEGGPLGSDDDDNDDEEDVNPWHEISTIAGAYCIVCRRGICIGEDAWWNHESRDVACSFDGSDLFEDEQMKIMMKKAMKIMMKKAIDFF